jgi:hypothetical protein
MCVGYISVDSFIASKHLAKGPSTTEEMSGGPTGEIPSQQAEMLKPQ